MRWEGVRGGRVGGSEGWERRVAEANLTKSLRASKESSGQDK